MVPFYFRSAVMLFVWRGASLVALLWWSAVVVHFYSRFAVMLFCLLCYLFSGWVNSGPFWQSKFKSIAAEQIENHCGCANLRPLWLRKFKTIVAG